MSNTRVRKKDTHSYSRLNLIKLTKLLKKDKCTVDYFIASIVITVKKDDSIKLALGVKPIYRQLYNNQY